MTRTSLAILLAVLLAVPPLARGQVSRLDDPTFVDELGNRGMRELLLHLVESGRIKDPVAAAKIEIVQYRLTYTDDQSHSSPQRRTKAQAALDRTIDLQKKLIQQHPEHEQQPLWVTDLAEMVFQLKFMGTGLHTGLFYDFGFTTNEQQELFESTVADLYVDLAGAEIRFRQLEDDLGRNEKRRRVLDNTGQWRRMFHDYRQLKTRYYMTLAAYHTALLDDSHPYFQNLGAGAVPGQRSEPNQERHRLLREVVNNAESFVKPDTVAMWLLAGRAMLKLGEHDGATAWLDRIIKAQNPDLNDLVAQLGMAQSTHQRGQTDAALTHLETLKTHPLIEQFPTYPWTHLLVVDLIHRIRLEATRTASPARRAAAIDAAYNPYMVLLAELRRDKRFKTPMILALQNHIYRRWETHLGDKPFEELPTTVIMGMGAAATSRGWNLIQQTDQARASQDLARAERLHRAAKSLLQRANEILEPLVERTDLEPDVRAGAMLNLGWSTYFVDKTDPDAVMAAVMVWTELAERLPDQPEAERAIGLALEAIKYFYLRPNRPRGYEKAYRRALEILFKKYPTAPVTDDERVSFCQEFLIPDMKYIDAIKILDHLPSNHRAYFYGQRERVYALHGLYRHTEDIVIKNRQRNRLQRQVQAVIGEAEKEMAKIQGAASEPELTRLTSARDVVAHGRMVLADVLADDLKFDEAIAMLDKPIGADDAELALLARSRHISILIKAGRFEDAADQATQTMQDFPTQGPLGIQSLVDQLERDIETLHRQAQVEKVNFVKQKLTKNAKSLAELAAQLAKTLVTWAQSQNWTTDEQLPLRLTQAQSLRLAGRFEEALDLSIRLEKYHSDDAEVVENLLESYFASGMDANDENHLIQAAKRCNLLIDYHEGQSQSDGRYPEQYWNAWMRRFQILDRIDKHTDEIRRDVSQLEQAQANLGGEPYSSEIRRLSNKHSK